jgi:hypothetical protein
MVDAMRPEDDVAAARGVLEVVAARQVVATHGVAEVVPVWLQDEFAAHRVVDDELRDEPCDVSRHPDARRRRSSRRRAARRATRHAEAPGRAA